MRNFKVLLVLIGLNASAQEIANVDSLKSIFKNSSKLHVRTNTAIHIGRYFNSVNIDSSKKYLAISHELVNELKDDKTTATYHLNQGNNYKNTGQYIKGVKEYEKAISIFERLKDTLGLANSYNSLGLIYKIQGGDNREVRSFSEKGLYYENQALELHKALKDTIGIISIYSNLGIIYRDMAELKKAETSFLKGLSLANKSRNETYSIGILNANLSQIYLDHYKDYDKAISLLNEAIRIYEKHGIRTSMEHAYRNLSYNYTGKKEYEKAIAYAQKAIEIAEEVDDDHRRINAYSSLYFAQKKAGLFEESLKNYEHVRSLDDSLFSIEKTNIIAEMDAKFESVKKDAQIKVLNANPKLSRIQKIGLAIGAILIAIIALGVVINLNLKRKREIELGEKEKAIAAEKLKVAKLETEHKQKELTAKILQLASKNHFLRTIEKETEALRENVDGSVIRASSRISRLLKQDVRDSEQWEQFSAEFSSLNQGFLDRLKSAFGSFSKSEFRLISLLKMNLSSREITDTLNITDDGLKKARYRLRKKLKLSSDEDIQTYILSF